MYNAAVLARARAERLVAAMQATLALLADVEAGALLPALAPHPTLVAAEAGAELEEAQSRRGGFVTSRSPQESFAEGLLVETTNRGMGVDLKYNNVWELLEEAAEATSEGSCEMAERVGGFACHVVNCERAGAPSDAGSAMTYRDLRARARQLAAFLALCGAKRGDRVGLMLHNSAAGVPFICRVCHEKLNRRDSF